MGFFESIGAGLVGAGAGFLMSGFNPIGAVAGFGIGVAGSAFGSAGSTAGGAVSGAAIGGIAGFMIGNVPGALIGAGLGALFGGAVAHGFNQQPQTPPYTQQFPPNFGNMGMPPYMGMPNMNYGFPQGNFGFQNFQGFQPPMQYNIHNYYNECPCHPPQQQPPQRGGGELKQDGNGKPITYTTSGGYKVTVNKDNVSIVDPSGKHTVTHSGDPHEYVDGKHVKDWKGDQRTLILSDGTKITMHAPKGNQGLVEKTSIYDGGQQIQIDNNQNQITKVGFNPYETQHAEHYQHDGETAYIGYKRDGSFTYQNIYEQSKDMHVTKSWADLATLPPPPREDRPIHHYWDRPRPHTVWV